MSVNVSLHPNLFDANSTSVEFWSQDNHATLTTKWNRNEVTMFIGRLSPDDQAAYIGSLEIAVAEMWEWYESRLEAEDE